MINIMVYVRVPLRVLPMWCSCLSLSESSVFFIYDKCFRLEFIMPNAKTQSLIAGKDGYHLVIN